MQIEIEIDCETKLCGACCHKFKGRIINGMRWMCNLFRTETDDGHTGTCLNSKDNKPIRCKRCQDATTSYAAGEE